MELGKIYLHFSTYHELMLRSKYIMFDNKVNANISFQDILFFRGGSIKLI